MSLVVPSVAHSASLECLQKVALRVSSLLQTLAGSPSSLLMSSKTTTMRRTAEGYTADPHRGSKLGWTMFA